LVPYAVGYINGPTPGSLPRKLKTSMTKAHPPKTTNVRPSSLGSPPRAFAQSAVCDMEMVVGIWRPPIAQAQTIALDQGDMREESHALRRR
jgi:hypothetical protein